MLSWVGAWQRQCISREERGAADDDRDAHRRRRFLRGLRLRRRMGLRT